MITERVSTEVLIKLKHWINKLVLKLKFRNNFKKMNQMITAAVRESLLIMHS